jgi:hypothetical protein
MDKAKKMNSILKAYAEFDLTVYQDMERES